MRNLTVNIDTLADLVRRGTRFSFDVIQFYDHIGVIRFAGLTQLAQSASRFLAEYGELDAQVVTAVREYLEAFPNGTLAEPTKRVLAASIVFSEAITPTEVVEILVQRASYAVQLDALCSRLLAFRNRAGDFGNMPEHKYFKALEGVFKTFVKTWVNDGLDLEMPPVPEQPFYRNSDLRLTPNTLKDIIEWATSLAEDIPAFADDVMAIKLIGYEQLETAVGPFLKEDKQGTRIAQAAAEFVKHKSDRDNKVEPVLQAARNYAAAFGTNPELSVLICAAEQSWSLAELTLRTEPLPGLAALYADISKILEFEALSTVFATAMESSCNAEPNSAAA